MMNKSIRNKEKNISDDNSNSNTNDEKYVKGKMILQYSCRLCNYKWSPKFDRVPKACPSCKAYAWKEKTK